MSHLTHDEIVDLAEGSRSAGSVPHLRSCARCQQQVDELRAILCEIAADQVPEPSPLFWDHLSARVREQIAQDRPAAPRRWIDRATPVRLGLAAVALVVIGLAVASMILPERSTTATPAVSAETAIAAEPADLTLPSDDAALDLVADLSGEIDWDEAHDAGIVAHTGLVDRAVGTLSADERARLGDLIKREVAGGGD